MGFFNLFNKNKKSNSSSPENIRKEYLELIKDINGIINSKEDIVKNTKESIEEEMEEMRYVMENITDIVYNNSAYYIANVITYYSVYNRCKNIDNTLNVKGISQKYNAIGKQKAAIKNLFANYENWAKKNRDELEEDEDNDGFEEANGEKLTEIVEDIFKSLEEDIDKEVERYCKIVKDYIELNKNN